MSADSKKPESPAQYQRHTTGSSVPTKISAPPPPPSPRQKVTLPPLPQKAPAPVGLTTEAEAIADLPTPVVNPLPEAPDFRATLPSSQPTLLTDKIKQQAAGKSNHKFLAGMVAGTAIGAMAVGVGGFFAMKSLQQDTPAQQAKTPEEQVAEKIAAPAPARVESVPASMPKKAAVVAPQPAVQPAEVVAVVDTRAPTAGEGEVLRLLKFEPEDLTIQFGNCAVPAADICVIGAKGDTSDLTKGSFTNYGNFAAAAATTYVKNADTKSCADPKAVYNIAGKRDLSTICAEQKTDVLTDYLTRNVAFVSGRRVLDAERAKLYKDSYGENAKALDRTVEAELGEAAKTRRNQLRKKNQDAQLFKGKL